MSHFVVVFKAHPSTVWYASTSKFEQLLRIIVQVVSFVEVDYSVSVWAWLHEGLQGHWQRKCFIIQLPNACAHLFLLGVLIFFSTICCFESGRQCCLSLRECSCLGFLKSRVLQICATICQCSLIECLHLVCLNTKVPATLHLVHSQLLHYNSVSEVVKYIWSHVSQSVILFLGKCGHESFDRSPKCMNFNWRVCILWWTIFQNCILGRHLCTFSLLGPVRTVLFSLSVFCAVFLTVFFFWMSSVMCAVLCVTYSQTR